jgi:hypothetical protein
MPDVPLSEPIRLDRCWWYHAMDLPCGEVGGEWDLRGRFSEYTGGIPLAGRSVIDVGAASGYLSFKAEEIGANVTSFDAASVDEYNVVPSKKTGNPDGFTQLRNSYWYAHRALGSKIAPVYGTVYRMSEFVQPADVVMIGQILVHLRDPLEAIRQAALVAKEQIIITEGSFESPHPISAFLGGKSDPSAWWHLSDTLYREWLGLVGFDVTSIRRGHFTCNAHEPGQQVELWTFVANRQA